MAYFAEVGPDAVVVRVVVADDVEWCVDNLGGTWVETANPYSDEPQAVTYCGPGHGFDAAFPERFCRVIWDADTSTTEQVGEDGAFWRHNAAGQLVFHNGKIWRNLLPTGTPNVWEPGVANWRNVPVDGSAPVWQQPTGAGDAYAIDVVVIHEGLQYRSLIPANTTTPGSDDRWWELLDVPDIDPNAPQVEAWVQPTGAHDAYQIGDTVTHNGKTWQSTAANNVWAPGVFGWVVI